MPEEREGIPDDGHRLAHFDFAPEAAGHGLTAFDVACSCGYACRLTYLKRYKVTEPGEVGQGGTLTAPHYPWLAAPVVLEATFDMTPEEALATIQAVQDSGAPWEWTWEYLQTQRPKPNGRFA